MEKKKNLVNTETYAKYVHWKETYASEPGFLILWSDGTWDEVIIPCGANYYINGKSIKQNMNLKKVILGKMKKDDAMKYINQRISKIMEAV